MQAIFVTATHLAPDLFYDSVMHPGGRPAKHPRSALGDRVAQARVQAGLSQIDLAKKLGVSQQVVAAWERKAKTLRTSTVSKLAEVLKTSTDQLLGVKAQPSKRVAPKGRLNQVFEAASRLPRRQQEKVVEFVEGFVSLHERRTGKA
jgi:transcriptional regulator with XRE-family HTH domain